MVATAVAVPLAALAVAVALARVVLVEAVRVVAMAAVGVDVLVVVVVVVVVMIVRREGRPARASSSLIVQATRAEREKSSPQRRAAALRRTSISRLVVALLSSSTWTKTRRGRPSRSGLSWASTGTAEIVRAATTVPQSLRWVMGCSVCAVAWHPGAAPSQVRRTSQSNERLLAMPVRTGRREGRMRPKR